MERKMLTPATIDALRQKKNPATGRNYTQSDIAAMYGVTRQHVSKLKRSRTSYYQTAREVANEHFPWSIGERFDDASPHKRMRDHGEYMATKGKGMNVDKLRRLAAFYRFLESDDLVVEFDPSIPPSEGIGTGGFAFRKRQESDGDLIIRVNEYTTLTAEGESFWVMPPHRPDVRMQED